MLESNDLIGFIKYLVANWWFFVVLGIALWISYKIVILITPVTSKPYNPTKRIDLTTVGCLAIIIVIIVFVILGKLGVKGF